MKIVLLLGERDEYLGYKKFETDEQVDKFLDSISNLMILNIEKTLPLRKRLLVSPEYFPLPVPSKALK